MSMEDTREGSRRTGVKSKQDNNMSTEDIKQNIPFTKSQETDVGETTTPVTKKDADKTGTSTEKFPSAYSLKRNPQTVYGSRHQVADESTITSGLKENADEVRKIRDETQEEYTADEDDFLEEIPSTDLIDGLRTPSHFSIYSDDLIFDQHGYPVDSYGYDMRYMTLPDGEEDFLEYGPTMVYGEDPPMYGNRLEESYRPQEIIYDENVPVFEEAPIPYDAINAGYDPRVFEEVTVDPRMVYGVRGMPQQKIYYRPRPPGYETMDGVQVEYDGMPVQHPAHTHQPEDLVVYMGNPRTPTYPNDQSQNPSPYVYPAPRRHLNR